MVTSNFDTILDLNDTRIMITIGSSIRRVVTSLVYLGIIATLISTMLTFYYPALLIDKPQEQCTCTLENAKSAVIYFEKPRRSYHGNHWYHIGEYFISRRKEIQRLMHRSNQSMVQVIAFDPHLSDMMTPFTFFLVMLTMQSTPASSIQLYRPLGKSHMKKLKRLLPRKTCNVDSEYSRTGFSQGYNINTSCTSDHQGYSWAPFSFRSPAPMYSFDTALHSSTVDSKLFSLDRRSYNAFDSAVSSSPPQCHCGQYLGRIGHTPLNSTEWFSDYSEAVAIQHTATALCSDITSYHPQTEGDFSHVVRQRADDGKKAFNLVIYERDKNRKFTDLMGMLRSINEAMDTSQWNIEIVYHSENINPCKLQRVMSKADVFLTSHGFQCMALMFMHRGSTLIEIFPYKYFKPTYIPLCAAFGVHHRHISNLQPSSANSRVLQIRSTQQCMADIMCRSFARHQNVMMPPDHIELVVNTLREVQSR